MLKRAIIALKDAKWKKITDKQAYMAYKSRLNIKLKFIE